MKKTCHQLTHNNFNTNTDVKNTVYDIKFALPVTGIIQQCYFLKHFDFKIVDCDGQQGKEYNLLSHEHYSRDSRSKY